MMGFGPRLRSKRAAVAVAALALALIGTVEFAIADRTSSAKPSSQTPSGCIADLQKHINPETVALGGSVDASLIVSLTCGASGLPVDLVIVADESYSMTRARGGVAPGGELRTPTRDPGATPDPRATPEGPGPIAGNEPAFCSAVENNAAPPTATRTPRRNRGTPTPIGGEEFEPLEAGGSEDLLREEKEFVRDLLDQAAIQRDMASDRLRVGFVSFAGTAKSKVPLSNDPADAVGGANRMRGEDLSNVKSGLQEAARMLASSQSRAKLGDDQRVSVVILMSDFQFCQRDMRGSALDKATHLITVGFGRNRTAKNQRDMATQARFVLERNDIKDFADLYEQVLAAPIPVAVTQLKVADQLAANMTLDPASVNPTTATITGQLIEWQLPTTSFPQTLTYRVEPQEPGFWPVSDSTNVEWTDSQGQTGSGVFPSVVVEVIPQTATPTPPPTDTPTSTPVPTATDTPTPTATATRIPADLYLPVTFRNWPECIPEEQTIDVALVLDTSVSMQDPTEPGGPRKLDAAIGAAREIVELLKDTDQAAVIGFNATSLTASTLTSDKAALTAALQGLPAMSASGTIIDSGLRAATEELMSERHRAGNKRSIILVTDGEQSNGDTAPVLAWAATAKSNGITVITVGLGTEIDAALLQQVASDPSLYYPVPNAADLQRIYREVARIIPCP